MMFDDWDEELCHDYDDEFEENNEDSGFLGSLLERQIVNDGQKICSQCNRKIASILDKERPNPCQNPEHNLFKYLFETRVRIGLHDLKTRGYD